LQFSQAANQLLSEAGCAAKDIKAIGSHGQTVRHRPELTYPFTLQIGDPNIIAANTGITTIADFRRMDMAHGGQGAPFAPAFHHQFFSSASEPRAVVNLGGIANVTLLQPRQSPLGFDTGPANTLMDQWITQHKSLDYDKDGLWASSGEVIEELLDALLTEDYFTQTAPKSTGCEYFNMNWVIQKTQNLELNQFAPEDVQRTLLQLTVNTVTEAIKEQMPNGQVYLCGGGAHNPLLKQELQNKLPNLKVSSTEKLGVAPDWVEAMTFAWFASKTLNQQPIALNSITGAHQNSILGGIYHA
jgi:anhydro-N-acetylmuramic acid kinase